MATYPICECCKNDNCGGDFSGTCCFGRFDNPLCSAYICGMAEHCESLDRVVMIWEEKDVNALECFGYWVCQSGDMAGCKVGYECGEQYAYWDKDDKEDLKNSVIVTGES